MLELPTLRLLIKLYQRFKEKTQTILAAKEATQT